MKKRKDNHKPKRAGTRILYQITAILIVVLVAAGLVTFFLIRGSQERFVENSIEKHIETDAEIVQDVYDERQRKRTPEFIELALEVGVDELERAAQEERISDYQRYIGEQLQLLVDEKVVPLEYTMSVLVESPLSDEPILYAANDESLVYNWEIPDYLLEAIEEGKPFIRMEDGIPELGLEGEHVIILGRTQDRGLGFRAAFVGVESLEEYLAETEEFYNREKKNLTLVVILVVGISIILVILIVFFLLRYLIHKKITEPIDELSAAAEQVVEGNLDVQVEVKEGEELEVLKRAFNSMVESWRKYIDRSMED